MDYSFQYQDVCPACNGEGYIEEWQYQTTNGEGVYQNVPCYCCQGTGFARTFLEQSLDAKPIIIEPIIIQTNKEEEDENCKN